MRLSDQPEPYAVVVMLPRGQTDTPPTTITVNGRVAKVIAWLLDHRTQIEHMRGGLNFNFGPDGYQAQVSETFPYERVAPSAGTDHLVVTETVEPERGDSG